MKKIALLLIILSCLSCSSSSSSDQKAVEDFGGTDIGNPPTKLNGRPVIGKFPKDEDGNCRVNLVIARDSEDNIIVGEVELDCAFEIRLKAGVAYEIELRLDGKLVATIVFDDDLNPKHIIVAEGESAIDLGLVNFSDNGVAVVENQPAEFNDLDNDGIVDAEDPDDDNDGIPDLEEADCNQNGVRDDYENIDCDEFLDEDEGEDPAEGVGPNGELGPEADDGQAPEADDGQGPELDEGLKIIFVDVGKGNAALILGSEKNLIIDSGRSRQNSETIISLLEESEIETLHYIISTHYDSDHIGAYNNLLWDINEACEPTPYFPSDAIIDLEISTNDSQTVTDYINCRNQNIDLLSEGHIQVGMPDTTADLFDENGVFIGYQINLGGGYLAQIVAGNGFLLGSDQRMQASEENERSLAILISGPQGFETLITGDLIGQEAGSEELFLEEALGINLNLDIDILGVGSHGSSNSSNPNFLESVNPEVSIISVGPNGHGHPTCQTLESLNQVSQYVLQTDLGQQNVDDRCPELAQESYIAQGSISIDVSGENYDIKSVGQTDSLLGAPVFLFECIVDLGC